MWSQQTIFRSSGSIWKISQQMTLLIILMRHSRHSQEFLCVVEGQCLGRVTQPDLEPLVILPQRDQERREDDNAQGGSHKGQRLPVGQLWWRVGLLRWRRRHWQDVVSPGPLGALGSGRKNGRIHRNTPAKGKIFQATYLKCQAGNDFSNVLWIWSRGLPEWFWNVVMNDCFIEICWDGILCCVVLSPVLTWRDEVNTRWDNQRLIFSICSWSSYM